MFFVLACFRFGACAPSPCAKCAPNQPKTAPAIHRGATERTPPARCAAPPRAFQFPRSAPRLPFCLPLCYPFACPSATPRAFVPRLPLGVRLCPPARLPLAPSPRTAAPACRSPQAKGGPLPTERPAPRRSIFPHALGPLLPVCLPACLAFCPSARLPLGRSSLGYPLATPRRAPLPARTATPRPIAADRRARVQITPSERRTAPHGTARPSALDIPSCARPFATRLLGLLLPVCLPVCLPLGYPSACAFARPLGYPSPHRRGPQQPRV